MKPNDKSGEGDKKPQKKLTPQQAATSYPLPKKRFDSDPSRRKDSGRGDQITGQFQNWGL